MGTPCALLSESHVLQYSFLSESHDFLKSVTSYPFFPSRQSEEYKLSSKRLIFCFYMHPDFFFPMAQQPLVGQGLLIIEASRSHSDTPHSIGLLWTSDQHDANPFTEQHTTLTRDKHPCPRTVSNLQSHQASIRRPML
jgi:hypothetical protein